MLLNKLNLVQLSVLIDKLNILGTYQIDAKGMKIYTKVILDFNYVNTVLSLFLEAVSALSATMQAKSFSGRQKYKSL